ncbi:hypothetical protein H072_828 [Dactylellina haptotyla CBS 200.50]|uniref:Btz domain-containing protein n=1 Tax=Dactylellina haptotyla (strain CBS 200.50) TaxID=1284197 RepID=S8CBT5_DACHA|nr:hypothetical protein H072_828 [Dactylellina haptotyla CBS 200.50]
MPRRKDVGLSRRRVRDEDEAEVGEEGAEVLDDSASEDSAFTDDEFDEDNESEETYSDDETAAAGHDSTKKPGANGSATVAAVEQGRGDTHVMMNGIRNGGDTEAVDFDELAEQDGGSSGRPADKTAGGSGKKQSDKKSKSRRAAAEPPKSAEETPSQTPSTQETPLERKRREAEEYRKKRDADPAFVPNRGAFFMHDHRSESAGANGFRPFGRGRGRNGFNGFTRYVISGLTAGIMLGLILTTTTTCNSSPDAGGAWKHDMHDEIVAAERERERQRAQRQAEQRPAPQPSQASQPAPQNPHQHQHQQQYQQQQQQQPQSSSMQKPLNNNHHPPNRFFDTTVHKGNVQIRVSLPGMKEPKIVDDFSVKIYTKLPYHRPPLRRDKPVRISLPEALPRYIYPAISRSFVFIPRAMRPGGSGFTRGGIVGGGLGPTPRRGSIAGSYRGGMQTGSVYGGTSTHAPSVAMSRRSSIHQDFVRPPISFGNIPAGNPSGPSPSMRPIVRLPVAVPVTGGMDHIPQEGSFVPIPGITDGVHQPHMQEVPAGEQKVAHHASHVPLPMHQPKPQKTVSVENIETPATGTYNFANTNYPTPGPYSDGIPTPGYYNQQHNRVPSYPSQTSTTPHSQIPDQAVHARPFQPAYPQPGYYYPIPPHAMYPPPMHPQPPMAHQPQGPPPPYVPSPAAMPYVPQGQMAAPGMAPPGPPIGTIAQEQNGTVYYYDSSQLYPGSYPQYMPPVAMVPPTSAPQPESQVPGAIHANGMYYYPPMVPVPMVPQGPVYYG